VVDALPPEDENVLLYWEGFPYDVGLWNGRSWQRAYYDMGEYDADPTHWMKLPAPPV
jgi:hypothetical protein